MTSKYASNFKAYREQVKSQQGFNSSNSLNFIGVSKKNPKIYVQVIGNELFPVPMHTYVPVPQEDGSFKSSTFICRKFVNDSCYICDHLKDGSGNALRPKTVRLALVIQVEGNGANRSIMREDVKTSKTKAEEIFNKIDADAVEESGIKILDDGENVIFSNIPRVGILQANKTMDDYFALTLSEAGSIDDRIFMIKRDGEGLATKYAIMSVGDALIGPEDIGLQIALAIHMSIDEYIDMFISEARYNRAFKLEDNESEKHEEEQEREADEAEDQSSDDDDEETVSLEEIMKKYRGASAKNRHEDA